MPAPVKASRGDKMFCAVTSAFQNLILKLKEDEGNPDRYVIRLSSRGSIEDVEIYADQIKSLIDIDDLTLWKTPTLVTKAFERIDAAYEFQLSQCDTAVDRKQWARNQGDGTRLLWRYFLKLVKRSKHSHNNVVQQLKKAFLTRHGSYSNDSESDDDFDTPSKAEAEIEDKMATDDDEEAESDDVFEDEGTTPAQPPPPKHPRIQAESEEMPLVPLDPSPLLALDGWCWPCEVAGYWISKVYVHPDWFCPICSPQHIPPSLLPRALAGGEVSALRSVENQLSVLHDADPGPSAPSIPMRDEILEISDPEEDVAARCHLTPGPPQAAAVIAQSLKVSEQATASTHGHHKRVMGTGKRKRLHGKQAVEQTATLASGPPLKADDPHKVPNTATANSMMAKKFTMELAKQTATLASGPPLKVDEGIQKLVMMEFGNQEQIRKAFKDEVLDKIPLDPEQRFLGIPVKVKFMNQRHKVIWQIKGEDNKALCQLQTREHPQPDEIMNTFLRSQMVMWFATAGVDKKMLKRVKALVDERGLFGD